MRLPKKLLEYGWDRPSPIFIRDHIREMEARPFDGVIFSLPDSAGGGQVFDVKQWVGLADHETEQQRQLEILSQIEWGRMSDSYLMLYGASTMDWFDDDAWALVLDQARFCARAARAARCPGLYWDPEPYGFNPWLYPKQALAAQKSFEAYADKVRERGTQFMQALLDEYPTLHFPSLRWLSDFSDGSHWAQRVLNEVAPEARAAKLRESFWGLHLAFLEGILDAAPPGLIIADGNEDAYYFASKFEFYRSYHLVRQQASELISPENRRRYNNHVRCNQSLYVDYVFGLWPEIGSFPLHLVRQARELSLEDQARWFEHNAYHALETADEHVWCYSENINWWNTPMARPTGDGSDTFSPDNDSLVALIGEALASARRKQAAGEPLGFEVEEMLLGAQAKALARLQKEG